MKQLLVSCIPFEFTKEQINESIKNNNGKLIVSGILQSADKKNQNGRVYPEGTLKREVDKYMKTYVAEHRAVGELDHPESSVVNLKNVSHNILEMRWDGDNLVGKVEVLTTPSGEILRRLFECGIKLGISSRALGSVKQMGENTVEVQDDLELICWDFVSNPSTRGAFMQPSNSLTEGVQRSVKNPVTGKYEKIENIIREIITEIG